MHVDEDLAQLAVVELAGAQIDLVAADNCFLGVAFAAIRQAVTFAFRSDFLDDDLLDDLFGHNSGLNALRRFHQTLPPHPRPQPAGRQRLDSFEPSR